MKYTEKMTVRWHDTDASRQVRPSEILVYMQETANRQIDNAGLSLDELRDTKKLAFILSKIKLVFHKHLFAYDKIDSRTWTCESKGYTFNRCFDIHKDGELVALESVRTQKKALARTCDLIKEIIGDRAPEDYLLWHIYTGPSLIEVLEGMEEKFGVKTNHESVIMSPVSGAHNGPWLAGYGLVFLRREDEPLE